MPDEKQMWDVLRVVMNAAKLDPVRVENPAMPGTPDVNYLQGWVELKHADQWPVRGGPLRLKHPPTPQQRSWLARRETMGGRAFLCLRVGREWLLFSGVVAAQLWSDMREAPPNETELRAAALDITGNPKTLLPILTGEKR